MIAATLPLPITPEAVPTLANTASAATQPFAMVAAQALATSAAGQAMGDGNAAAAEQGLPPDEQILPPGSSASPADPGSAAGFTQMLSRSLFTGGAQVASAESPGDAGAAPQADDMPGEDGNDIMPALWLPATITEPVVAASAATNAGPSAANGVVADQAPGRPSRTRATQPVADTALPRLAGPLNFGDESSEGDGGEPLSTADIAATSMPQMDPHGNQPRRELVSTDGTAAQPLAVAAAPHGGDGAVPPTRDTSVLAPPTFGATAASMLGGSDQAAPAMPARSSAETMLRLPQPLHDPHWPAQFATRIDWLTGAGVTDARIMINPPDLGPIDVRITLQEEQAQIHFTVQHDAVRDAVQESLPRLRDLLQQSGLQLANADVSTGRHSHSHAASQAATAYGSPDASEALAESAPAGRTVAGSGFIDTYI